MKSIVLISSLLLAATALAQKPDAAAPAAAGDLVVTKHTITFHGAPLAYAATTGTLPIRNDDGDIEGTLFFVAYTKDDADSASRPVTFAYNGGPGSSSMWLHM